MDITLKIQTSVFVENCCMQGYDFYMTVSRNEAATQKTLVSIPGCPQFFLRLNMKKLAIVGKIL